LIICRDRTVMDTVQEISHRVFRKRRIPSLVMIPVREISQRLMLAKTPVFRKAAHVLAVDDASGENSPHGGNPQLHVLERTHFLAADTTVAGNPPTTSHPWDLPGLTSAEQLDLRLRRAVERSFPGVLHVQDNPCRMHTID
jgi:hypothetical protein